MRSVQGLKSSKRDLNTLITLLGSVSPFVRYTHNINYNHKTLGLFSVICSVTFGELHRGRIR